MVTGVQESRKNLGTPQLTAGGLRLTTEVVPNVPIAPTKMAPVV